MSILALIGFTVSLGCQILQPEPRGMSRPDASPAARAGGPGGVVKLLFCTVKLASEISQSRQKVVFFWHFKKGIGL